MRASGTLSAALEAALVRQLAETWDELNGNHFGRRLRRPTITLSEANGRLGAWIGARRTLELSRALLLERSWGVVREVLKHEMAHQFVEEALGVRDESAHGPTFAATCAKLGIDAAAAGLPALEASAEEDGGSPVLRRIAKLLALAESPNQHEAELAMRQAQRLMLRHNIDEATAQARAGFSFRQLGAPKQRLGAHEQILASLLGAHFFVEAIWVPSYVPAEGRAGRVLEICGTPANLEVAGYVHAFLLETSERLWREHKRARGLSGDRERRRFLLGVMMGFEDKLGAGAEESRREGLVWAGDPALTTFLRRRYPRRSSGGAIGFQRTAAYEEGRAAGRAIVLHKPVTSGGDGGMAPRLLGAKR